MKVRFALARALVWKPKLLVLDEPLANLDFIAQQVFLKDLRNLANSLRYPVSVLISSQHLHEIEEVSDDILYLKQGQVLYSGPVGQIGARRKTNAFELGGAVDLARLQRVLAGSGFKRLYHSGVSFVVTTPTSVAAPQLLRLLLDAGVQLDYFRDISHSIKGLFEEDLSERSTPPSS
jgi:ABC-2 type transport system ATP-binding protein